MSADTSPAKRSHIRLQLARPDFTLDVDLDLPGDGITVLFGASGSGKTSLLRCVAGLERIPGALVSIASETWQDDAANIYLPTWQRPLGYVFQEASLFAHLNVRKNLQFGLKRSHSPSNAAALDAAIELLGIGGLLDRATGQLSGGERQRVAIARALATQPRLLLLDEPLASLDQARRQDILPWLERLRDELKIPMLYVTHSSDEVARLADTLVVLDAGQVKACGPVSDVLTAADASAVLGDDVGALLDASVAERDTRWHMARLDFNGGSLWLRDTGLALGHKVRVRVLARDISVATQEPQQTSIQNLLPCTVQSIVADTHPSQALVRLVCGDSVLLARISARAVDALQLAPGKAVWAQVKAAALVE
ncbi:MAG: molybdenum ABC transporter ATP-binding protein [Pseudomonadota bacterium]